MLRTISLWPQGCTHMISVARTIMATAVLVLLRMVWRNHNEQFAKRWRLLKVGVPVSTLLALAIQTQAQNDQEPSQSTSVCMTSVHAVARTLKVRERSTKVCSAPLHSKENTLAKFQTPQILRLGLLNLKPSQLLPYWFLFRAPGFWVSRT